MFFHAALACCRIPPLEGVQDILVGLDGVGRVLRDVEGLAPEVLYMLFHLFADADQQLVAAELHDGGVELLVVIMYTGHWNLMPFMHIMVRQNMLLRFFPRIM